MALTENGISEYISGGRSNLVKKMNRFTLLVNSQINQQNSQDKKDEEKKLNEILAEIQAIKANNEELQKKIEFYNNNASEQAAAQSENKGVAVNSQTQAEYEATMKTVREQIEKIQKKNDDLEKEKASLESSLETIRTQKSNFELEKYQLTIECDRLRKEISVIKDRKQKIAQVCANLEQKLSSLQSDHENLKNSLRNSNVASENEKNPATILVENENKSEILVEAEILLNECVGAAVDKEKNDSHKKDLERKLAIMEKLVLSSMVDKRNLKQQLELLQKKLDENAILL